MCGPRKSVAQTYRTRFRQTRVFSPFRYFSPTMPPISLDFPTLLLLVFTGATLVQLCLIWGVFARFAFGTAGGGRRAAGTLSATVIICARNEAENLRRNLPAVLGQQFPGDWELLVVDDASTDATAEVLARFQQKHPQLRVIQLVDKKRPGKKDALAAGIAAARFDNIVVTDADCRPASPHWLAKMTARLDAPGCEIVLGYAPYLPNHRPNFLNRWIRFEAAWAAVQYFAFAVVGQPYMGVGRNLAWKKSLFAAVGGFAAHADLPSGDDDLFVNAAARHDNTAILIDPDTFVFSEGKPTWATYFRQKTRHFSTGKRYRWLHRVALGASGLTHTLHFGCGLLLLIFGADAGLVLALYLVRLVSVWLVLIAAFRKLREADLWPFLPVFDGLLAVFYTVFTPTIFLRRKNRDQTWAREDRA
jgi:poly-beta-1,6-N-acetyl-D-glucosamine synthase